MVREGDWTLGGGHSAHNAASQNHTLGTYTDLLINVITVILIKWKSQ